MPYAILIKASAAKELDAIDSAAMRRRIVELIQSLATDPRPPACKKLAGRDGVFRVRAGDSRIVYRVNERENIVEVIKIGHQRKIYRREHSARYTRSAACSGMVGTRANPDSAAPHPGCGVLGGESRSPVAFS